MAGFQSLNYDAVQVYSEHDAASQASLENSATRPQKEGRTTDLFKVYSGKNYTHSVSITYNIECKYMIYLGSCKQVDIAEENMHRDFSKLITGLSRQFYSDVLKPKSLLHFELNISVKSHFLTLEQVKFCLGIESCSHSMGILFNCVRKSRLSALNSSQRTFQAFRSSFPLHIAVKQQFAPSCLRRSKTLHLAAHIPKSFFIFTGWIYYLYSSLETKMRKMVYPSSLSEQSAHLVD